MTDEPALLAAVAAAPDDDTPRLVYADWLDDHGRPERAEFIRVGCRLAAATPADDDYPDLLDRRDELASWLTTFEPLPPDRPDGPLRVTAGDYARFRRGFPEAVTALVVNESRSEFRRLVNALGKHLAKSPARSLDVHGLTAEGAAELVRHPVAAGLRGLALEASDDDFELSLEEDDEKPRMTARSPAAELVAGAIAASPHLTSLRRLSLRIDLTDAAAALLAGANLPALAELELGVSVAAPRAVARLAGAAWFRNLRVLRVGTHLGVAHLEALAALPPFPRLHTLDLSDNRFEWIALRALAQSQSFPALASLDLHGNPLDEEGVGHLAKARWSVRELNLRSCGFGDADLRRLLRGRLLDGVRVLDLSTGMVGDPGLRALAESPKLAELRHLSLAWAAIGPAGFAALAESPHLSNLTRLGLATGQAEPEGSPDHAARFLERVDAPNLRRLVLESRPVGAAGAKALASRPTFANLRWLGLTACRVGDEGVAALAASPRLRELVWLDLSDNGITTAAALADPAVFPRLARCRLGGNPLAPADARALAARRAVQVDQTTSGI